MWKRAAVAVGAACVCSVSYSAQTPATDTVDFARDVQPIFRQRCIGCHGPTQHMNGFRLDRRRDAMLGGTGPVIGPGNAAGSRLYLRLVDNTFGPQMPPTGALPPEQVRIIKDWIDQGAEWPDALAGDVPPSPTSPLMRAVLEADAATVRQLLEGGADPNARNDAGATALMWVGTDAEKAKLLLDRGADPSVISGDGRTALIVAAGLRGSEDVVRLLLDRGADPSPKPSMIFEGFTPLIEAASYANEPVFALLVAKGVDVKAAAMPGLFIALRAQCRPCAEAFLKSVSADIATRTMVIATPPFGDARDVPLLLEHGASANGTDHQGRSVLMLAAASDTLPIDSIRRLIDGGADVNAASAAGETALKLARQRGRTPVVEALLKAGATDAPAASAVPSPSPAVSARAAIERSVPLLQRADATFLKKSGCVSCHNDTLTAMTVSAARAIGVKVDERVARAQRDAIGAFVDGWRDRALLGIGIPGDSDTVSYILLGLAAERYAPDAGTDAMARFLKRQQSATGQWRILAHRPPLESSDIEVTAASMRSLQLYAPKAQKAEFDRAIGLAAQWLAGAQPTTTEDRAFRLLGLAWSGAGKDAITTAGRALAAAQRPDGGWAQIPTLESDAYATGQAVFALVDSGALSATDATVTRGVQFLLKTQLADGSWFVRSRAIAIQPHFEADFPHGRDQFISAAATNWAAMALAKAVKPRS